jgi:hypothetical protein
VDPHFARHADRVASAIATRLHSELERAPGRDVEVTLLDLSTCDDGRALFDRLRERSDDRTGTRGVAVLDWDDIRHRSIAHRQRPVRLSASPCSCRDVPDETLPTRRPAVPVADAGGRGSPDTA